MIAYQQGEYTAFTELYDRHAGRVYGYLRARLSEEAEAADILQNVFLKLHENRRRYNGRFPFLPWLFTIARNLLIDHWRKHKAIPVEAETFEALPSPEPGADEEVLVRQALEQLSPDDRRLIELRFDEGLSFSDLARRLGISDDSARKRVSRLFRRLRGEVR